MIKHYLLLTHNFASSSSDNDKPLNSPGNILLKASVKVRTAFWLVTMAIRCHLPIFFNPAFISSHHVPMVKLLPSVSNSIKKLSVFALAAYALSPGISKLS